MQAVGAVGMFLMAWPARGTFVVGLLAAVGIGWGWAGLMHYVVSHSAGPAAAAATGTVSVGNYVGNALVPLLVGIGYHGGHDRGTWFIVATAMAVAAMLALLVARSTPSIAHGHGGPRD